MSRMLEPVWAQNFELGDKNPLGVPNWKLNACIKTLESVRAKDRDFKFVTK